MQGTRHFSTTQRAALFLAAGGTCTACGKTLDVGWHADHRQPYASGGETDVVNGQALCPTCNTSKGSRVHGRPGTVLREWQRRALQQYANSSHAASSGAFLVVATPGAGKTLLAGSIAGQHLRAGDIQRVVVVVPTERLKRQWADALAPSGIQLDPDWSNGDGHLPAGFHGVAVTYAAIAALPDLMRRHASDSPTLVIFDEIHHCGDTRSWGAAIRQAFGPARYRLALSGTPFRSDSNPIPFIRYIEGVGQADFIYHYGDAIVDKVCRPVYFPRRGGRMEWATGTETVSATFDEELDLAYANQRLATALSADGEWLASVLADAHQQLLELRDVDAAAGGLILARDQAHAHRIGQLLAHRHGVVPAVITSEDPAANKAIERFAAGDAPWLVAVRMVSEGVDIPRLRVGVFAATTTTELFFRQAVGRLVRVRDPEAAETATMYIPDDSRLRSYAENIRAQRDHALNEEARDLLRDAAPSRDTPLGPLSSFRPISAEAIDAGVIIDGEQLTPVELQRAAELKAQSAQTAALPTVSVALLLRMLQPLPGAADAQPGAQEGLAPAYRRKESLRRANDQAAKRLGFQTGMDFAEVNRRLNEAVDIRSIRDADLDTLERRLLAAQRWLGTPLSGRSASDAGEQLLIGES